MISRVAEHCFWLGRYVERLDAMARLLRVNRIFVLDVELPREERWLPIVIISGERERLAEHLRSDVPEGDAVEAYFTWDERSPVSLRSSLYWARENARTIREVISLEMWEVINGGWQWFDRGPAQRLFKKDRDAFYREVRILVDQFRGLSQSTLLREEPHHFMGLGALLERAGQTARALDTRHHTLDAESKRAGTAVELARWNMLLASCSAREPFAKRNRGLPTGRSVAAFLVLERTFPRSVRYCLDEACLIGRRISPRESGRPAAQPSLAALDQLRATVAGYTEPLLFEDSIHALLTSVIEQLSEVCAGLHRDYFDPSLPDMTARAGAPPPVKAAAATEPTPVVTAPIDHES